MLVLHMRCWVGSVRGLFAIQDMRWQFISDCQSTLDVCILSNNPDVKIMSQACQSRRSLGMWPLCSSCPVVVIAVGCFLTTSETGQWAQLSKPIYYMYHLCWTSPAGISDRLLSALRPHPRQQQQRAKFSQARSTKGDWCEASHGREAGGSDPS